MSSSFTEHPKIFFGDQTFLLTISNYHFSHWCGSTYAFPFGEGGTAIAVTEEALPQYEFAENHQLNGTWYRTSPAPFGGTLPKGEGFVVQQITI